MASSIPSVSGAVPSSHPAAPKINISPRAATASADSPPDRIALQGNLLPDLLVGATVAAQLVPGVMEAEGATGAASAVGTAVRAATASPAAKALIAAGAGAAGSYVKSLLHDATAGQPAFKAVTGFGHALDASVRATFGIPQSAER